MVTARLPQDEIDRAVEALRDGEVVAFPTETVYGLGADAQNPEAVRRVFELKGRPATHPLIVHLAGFHAVEGWAADVSDEMATLAAACWPGPLTMLVPRGPRVHDVITGGRRTVGLRVPAHHLTRELLERFGGGLAAPSANPFGRVSPTRAEHVLHDLAGRLDPARDLVLDGGPCPVGVESTIVDLTTSPPQVLRAGAISAADVERLLEAPVADATGPSRASGMLASHYAPDCRILLVADRGEASRVCREHAAAGERVDVLDRTDDLVEAARLLYGDLRDADRAGLDTLVVVLPPAAGIGHAVRDRLTKAAAAAADPDRSSRGG